MSSFFWLLSLSGGVITGAIYLVGNHMLLEPVGAATAAVTGVAVLASFWDP